jgi:oligopeptide/dipeptide ABC transporter ATP-binding protein
MTEPVLTESTATEPIVSVEGLVHHYPLPGSRQVVRAVEGVSLELHPGRTLGLVGESGCGKSTLGRAILNLVTPTAGQVRHRGQVVAEMSPERLRIFRKEVQVVFQDPQASLNPRLRVGDALEEVLQVHRLHGDRQGRRRRVAELLARVGLEAAHAHRLPHALSGGERQRVGIARALAVEPRVLVLDEPVSALDVSVRAQVVNLLAGLQEELGLSYLFIAHDLALVEHLSHQVAVMYLGRIVERGPTSEVLRNPRHPYTQALLSAVPRVDRIPGESRGRVLLPGEVPSPVSPPPGCPFHPRCLHPRKDATCARERPPLVPISDGTHGEVACSKVRAVLEDHS